MRGVATNDLAHIRGSVFFEGPEARRKLSRFWILLTLAAIIASAGVVADSTATVIGAMIVAPLMTPIMGTMLAIILADKANLIRSLTLVGAGAVAAIAIGYLVGVIVINDVVAETNSQVAGRVNPRLIDLLAALATGVVGSVALVRSDISDTLPGVAIAISLVPPLTVVGLTLEAGEVDQALGALLLFLTNFAAIITTGLVVMAFYGIHRLATAAPGDTAAINRRNAILAVAVMLVVIGIPLVTGTVTVVRDTARESNAQDAATAFGDAVNWSVVNVTTQHGEVHIEMEGELPLPDTALLKEELEAHGVDPSDVQVDLIPIQRVEFD